MMTDEELGIAETFRVEGRTEYGEATSSVTESEWRTLIAETRRARSAEAKLRKALERVLEEIGKPTDVDAEGWYQDAHKPYHWLQEALKP